jgi:hypothetical protein
MLSNEPSAVSHSSISGFFTSMEASKFDSENKPMPLLRYKTAIKKRVE